MDSQVAVGLRAPGVLVVALILLAALTIFGLVRFWTAGDSAQAQVGSTPFAVPGVSLPTATVVTVLPTCPPTPDAAIDAGPGGATDGSVPGSGATCGAMTVRLDPASGGADPKTPAEEATVPVPAAVTDSGVRAGDHVQLIQVPAGAGTPTSYSFLQVQRSTPLLLLLAPFVLVVAMVASWRGIRALVGLFVGGLVVVKFMLPALLEGRSGVAVALAGSAAIMFVVLYLAHGLTMRTSTALAGALFGVGITSVLGLVAVEAARLSGVASDEGAALTSLTSTLQPRDLLTCAIIVAGLGVLNDVTMTQSSAVGEARSVAPGVNRRDLFTSGMRIGRDHIASTI